MRLLFLLLLLANFAFFAWEYRQGALDAPVQPAPVLAARDEGVPTLTLLSERGKSASVLAVTPETAPPAQAVEAGAPAAAPPPAPAAAPTVTAQTAPETPRPAPAVERRCLAVGPFPDRAAIERAAALADAAGVQAIVHETAGRRHTGYWIRLPDALSSDAARRKMSELQGKGIKDIAIVPLGNGVYAVSLGVYSQDDTLEERRQRLKAAGYTPAVINRYRTTTAFTLNVVHPAGDAALDGLLKDLTRQFPQAEQKTLPCE